MAEAAAVEVAEEDAERDGGDERDGEDEDYDEDARAERGTAVVRNRRRYGLRGAEEARQWRRWRLIRRHF